MIKWSILSVLVIVAFPLQCISQSSNGKSNYTFAQPVDLVLVVDDSGSINNTDFEKMMGVVRNFANLYPMSEDNVKIGVVRFSDGVDVLRELTADANAIRNLPTPPRMGGVTRTDLALEEALTVMKNARSKAHKVILLITDGEPQHENPRENTRAMMLNWTEMAANELWKRDISVYVGFSGDKYEKQPDLKASINEKIARDQKRVFPFDDFEKLKKILDEFPERLVCDYAQVCQYDHNGECKQGWWRPLIGKFECTNAPPTNFHRPCNVTDCQSQCEEWMWEDAKCDESNAGQTIKVGRNGSMPDQHKEVYEHCPKEKDVVCPTMSTPEQPSTAEEPPTPEEPSTPEQGTTDQTSTKRDPGAAVATEDDAGGKKGMDVWVIVVIVVVAVLVLVLIIVVAVIITRRKKKQKQKEAAKRAKVRADAERASMKKSSAKGKSGMSSSMGALDYDPRGKGKKAEHSVLASMNLDQTKKPSKTPSGSGAKKSMPPQPKSKSVSKGAVMKKK